MTEKMCPPPSLPPPPPPGSVAVPGPLAPHGAGLPSPLPTTTCRCSTPALQVSRLKGDVGGGEGSWPTGLLHGWQDLLGDLWGYCFFLGGGAMQGGV